MRMSSVLDEYFLVKEMSQQTRIWYRQKLDVLLDWMSQQDLTEVEALTPVLAQRFMRARSAAGISCKTVHGYGRAIKAFAHWCVRNEYLPAGFLEKMDMPKQETTLVKTFTKQEVALLLNACKNGPGWLAERDRAIVLTLLDTGVRAAELCGLRLEDLHLKSGERWLRVVGKGNKEREVPVGRDTAIALHRYLHYHRLQQGRPARETPYVFPSHKAEKLTPQGLDKMLYRLRDSIQQPLGAPVRAHVFRHTMARMWVESGNNVLRLSRILGHTNVGITEQYLRTFTSRLARQGAYSAVDNL